MIYKQALLELSLIHIFVNTGKVTISGNAAKWDVGALQGANGLEFINNRGGVRIENNSVDGVAGAMLLYYKDAVFSADQGDIIVKGNTEKRGGEMCIRDSSLGWTHRVELEEGVERIYRWYLGQAEAAGN